MKTVIIPQPVKLEEGEGYVDSGATVRKEVNGDLWEEGYRLTIDESGILIEGGSPRALIHGETTLEQIRMQHSQSLPFLCIEDYPTHPMRMFHIDCARHFFSVEELKKMIRMAAFFKLNTFHWHFADDQGWRIECLAYPLLHEIGGFRKGDHFGRYLSDEPEGGYYTREQVKELVAYCQSLGIEVVPEVDMPGHVTAILAAYPQLSCRKEPMEVATKGGIFEEIFCAGQEETFAFIEHLLDDLLELFPGKYFHIGGDEAPKQRWQECPACRKRMQTENLSSADELQGYVENRIIAFLKKKGRTAIVWNDAANGGNLDADAMIQLWTEDKDNMAAKHIQKGGKVILSNEKNCYCNFPYGHISLRDVYGLDTSPKELQEAALGVGKKGAVAEGTECLLWSELVRDTERLEKFCWPRFTASAEVGWCGEDRHGYEDFVSRLQVLWPAFAKFGIEPMPEEGWTPSEEESKRQREEFYKDFD